MDLSKFPETDPQKHLLDLLKDKRNKFRSEIRNTRLSSELNEKRLKLLEFVPNSNHYVDITHQNNQTFYEEVASFLHSQKNSGDIIGLEQTMLGLKNLMTEDLEHCLRYIEKFKIIEELGAFLEHKYDDCVDLQLKTLWNLANIISMEDDGDYLNGSLIKQETNIIHNLMRMLEKNNDALLQNVIWTLGNIAGKSYAFRSHLFNLNIVDKIIDVFEDKRREFKTVNEAIWLVSNLCLSASTEYEELKNFFPLLRNSITIQNPTILESTLWSLAYLSDGENERVKEVLDLQITARVLALALNPKKEIKTPAVRTISNLLTSEDKDTQIVIENGLFDKYMVLLDDDCKLIRKEVSWGLANVFSCNEDIIEQICSHKIIDKIFNHCLYDELFIREELIMGLASAVQRANKNEMQLFVEKEVLSFFLDMLEYSNSNLMVRVLKGLEEFMYFLREHRPSALEDSSLRKKLEALQYHPDQTVLEMCQKIIDKFYFTD